MNTAFEYCTELDDDQGKSKLLCTDSLSSVNSLKRGFACQETTAGIQIWRQLDVQTSR